MARIHDFVLDFRGIKEPPDFAEVTDAALLADTFDRAQYDAAVRTKGGQRTLTVLRGQAGGNIDKQRDDVLQRMSTKLGGNFGDIGTFGALGASNSCSLILAVAAALAAKGAPTLTFIGLIDVTFVPFGRSPAIDGVGNLTPINPPDLSKIPGGAPWRTKLRRNIRSANIPPPVIRISGKIDCKEKRQIYQKDGNAVKLVKKSPLTGNEDWWWTSDMEPTQEVHGEIEGWDNPLKAGPGSTDDLRHVNCINNEIGWLKRDLARAIADLPP